MPIYEVQLGGKTIEIDALDPADLDKKIPEVQAQLKLSPGAGQTTQPGGEGGFFQGLAHGVTAPVRGARQLWNYAGTHYGSEESRRQDAGKLAELQRQEQIDSDRLGTAGQIGNVIGQVGTAFIPVAGWAGKGAQAAAKAAQAGSKSSGILSGLGKGAATGAAVSALDPTKEGDFESQKGQQLAVGAGLGVVGRGASNLLGGWGSKAKEASEALGGKATPGQLLSAAKGSDKYTRAERELGDVVNFGGITAKRDAAHEAGVQRLLAKEAEKAGVNVKDAKNFSDLFQKVQEGKKQGYEGVKSQLTFGGNPMPLARQSFSTHTANLTGPVRDDVSSALAEAGFSRLAGKSSKGGQYSGGDVQDVLSTLNKQISSRFAHNASRTDNAAGEALQRIRDDLLAQVEKASPGEAVSKLRNLNRLHQMTGSDVQTKSGVFGRAGTYSAAQERGTPTLKEVSRAATSGKQTKARNEIAQEASRVEDFAGRHSSQSTNPTMGLRRGLGDVASLGANAVAALPARAIYNDMSISLLNKLAQNGDATALRILRESMRKAPAAPAYDQVNFDNGGWN